MSLFGRPTLLRVPAWHSNRMQDEIVLPLPREAYDAESREGAPARPTFRSIRHGG